MSTNRDEFQLAECVKDYHRRRALREPVESEDYRERLGDLHVDFLDILAAEEGLDQAINSAIHTAPESQLPRPFGEYTLTRRLGRGNMGIVYEAVHRPLGRKVAIKVMRTGFDMEPVAIDRFRQEAHACAQVRHDNIIEIYEAGECDGTLYYSMPRHTGRTLAQLIEEGEVPEPRELCRGLAAIADALAHLHEAGIVHRDVKPSNILVDPDGRMILADFGLARTEASLTLTRPGQAPGTPLYMSPEQILGQRDRVDGRSDVYGLGVTLYESMTGQAPFMAENMHQLIRMIISEMPRPIRDAEPGVSPECACVVMKAIERRREDRYQTAASLRDDLLAIVDGRPVSGRPISRVRHFLRRNGYRLMAAAAAILLFIGYSAWLDSRPETVTFASLPHGATVLLDGNRLGETPFETELSRGRYRFRFLRVGYSELTVACQIQEGGRSLIVPLSATMEAIEKRSDVLPELSGRVDVESPFIDLSATRSAGRDEARVRVMFPRGAVRVEDLLECRVEVADEDYRPRGTLEIRRGEEVLFRAPYVEPGNVVTRLPIPQGVRDSVQAGDGLIVGYYPERGSPITVSVEVVSREVAESIRTRLLAVGTALEEQPPMAVRYVRCFLFLEHGLNLAALAGAREIVAERDSSVWGWALCHEAARRMRLDGTLLVSEEIADGLERFSQEKLEDVLGSALR
jgi:serine/threonine protein kinase